MSLIRLMIGIAVLLVVFITAGIIYVEINQAIAIIYSLVTFAIWCSFLAKTKNRSLVAWFFIGLFSGFIGLAFILSLKDAKK